MEFISKTQIIDFPRNVSDFQNDAGFITASVGNLVNYYLKSETYTKAEVAALIGAIRQFHYEIYASTSEVTSPAGNVLYLIGPAGSGSDKYEEYIYANSTFVKIGDTSIDLSQYSNTEQMNAAINLALTAYTTTANLQTLLAAKQDTINDLEAIRSGASAGATAYQKPQAGIPTKDLKDFAMYSTLTVSQLIQNEGSVDSDSFKTKLAGLRDYGNKQVLIEGGTIVIESNGSTFSAYCYVTDSQKPKHIRLYADSSGNWTITVTSLYTKPSTGIPATDLATDIQTTITNASNDHQLVPAQATAQNQLADKSYVTTSISTAVSTKQDNINDLTDIRSGAGLGATAYQKPQTGIPASDIASGVIPDISGKVDKVSGATNGHLAGLDSNGNLTDSGVVAADIVASSSVRTVVLITQSDYDALATKDANTEYNIIESV